MWPSLRRFTMKLLSYRDVWEDGRLWPLRWWTVSWSHVPNIHSLFVCCSLELIYICIGGECQWSIKKIWWVPPATQVHFPCCAQLNTLTPINKPKLLPVCLYLSCSFIMIFQPADLRRSNPDCQGGHLFPLNSRLTSFHVLVVRALFIFLSLIQSDVWLRTQISKEMF